MTTRCTKAARLMAMAALALPLTSFANPFTYQFVTPQWDLNQSAALFGTGLDLTVTVDNGGASANNQTFNFTDITSLSAHAIGGSFSFAESAPWTYSANPLTTVYNGNAPVNAFMTTDSSGVATINLVSAPGFMTAGEFNYLNPSATASSAASGLYQFIITQEVTNSDTATIAATYNTGNYNYVTAGFQQYNPSTGFVYTPELLSLTSVSQSPPTSSVAEPGTLALFCAGLAALGLGLRKKMARG